MGKRCLRCLTSLVKVSAIESECLFHHDFDTANRPELSINPDLIRKLVPTHAEPDLKARGVDVETFVPISLSQLRINPDASDVVL